MTTCCTPTLRAAGIRHDPAVAGVVGAASALVTIAGTWLPSFWGDEAASIMSAQREWSSLFALLGNVDAVHGFYYVLLHGWIEVFGASAFAVRLPSGLAVGAASAGLYLLVRRRASPAIALIAAGLFVVMPRVSYLGSVARSMALAMAAGVWLTLLLLRLLDRAARPVWWIVYAVGLAAGSYVFLYLVLLIPVHIAVVVFHLVSRSGTRALRSLGAEIRPFALAWTGAAVLTAPIFVTAVMQREQIAFREQRDVVNWESVLAAPWFIVPVVALASWSLIAVAVVAAVLHRHDPAWRGRRELLILSGAWIVVPTAALLVCTALITPVFTPRYLGVTAPAVAIAMAVGVSALPGLWPRAVAITAIVAMAAPTFIDQRMPHARHGGTDWQALSAVVEEVAEPGDGILFDEDVRPSRRPRLAMHTYPEGFQGLVDLTLVRPFHETAGLWDVTAPLASVASRLDGIDRVIVVSRSRQGVDADVDVLRREGFDVVERVALTADELAVYERTLSR
jgi:mannosyltransferase